MSINPVSSLNPHENDTGLDPVTSLEERLQGLSSGRHDSSQNKVSVPDADYQALYAALIGAEEGFDVQEFFRSYLGADDKKTFNTIGAQMEVLQKVMAQLKEEGMESSISYKLASKAFGVAFSMNFMIQQYMRESMSPSNDEDSRENIVW